MNARTFLVLEALVDEEGGTEIRRAYETTCAPRRAPQSLRQPLAIARLVDSDDHVLTQTSVELRFPQGCQSNCTQVGRAFVRAIVPRNSAAQAFELAYGDQLLARLPVSAEPPKIANLTVKVTGNGKAVQARWAVDGKSAPDVRLSLLIDGREYPVDAKPAPNGASFELDPWAGLGQAALRVTASQGFRTVRMNSEPFALPTGATLGRILVPLNGESWDAGRRGSLIANLFDGAGRPVPWDPQRIRWVLDGKPLEDTRNIADPGELAGGRHVATLVLDDGTKKTRELDRVEFTVRDEAPAMKEWRGAVERHLARHGAPTVAAATQP